MTNIESEEKLSTALSPPTPANAAAIAANDDTTKQVSTGSVGHTDEYYPPPVSSYYFGPPDPSRAFGEPVTGVPGTHLPKEIVRIERDYSSGELPQFHSSFPLELEGRISPTTFSEIINDLNTLLIKAHNPTRTWIDNTISILTFYLSTLVFGSHHQNTMKEIDAYITKANKETLNEAGLNLVDPEESGYLFIELEYY